MKPSTSFPPSQQRMPSRKTPAKNLDSLDIAIIGGYNESDFLSNVDVIRISAGVVSSTSNKLPQLPIGLTGLRGVLMENKREILISGGYSNNETSHELLSLNLDGKSWIKCQKMSMMSSIYVDR